MIRAYRKSAGGRMVVDIDVSHTQFLLIIAGTKLVPTDFPSALKLARDSHQPWQLQRHNRRGKVIIAQSKDYK